MNSLPLISHRLFVAAIGSLGRGQSKPARRNPAALDPDAGRRSALRRARQAAVIPLEVLADSRFLPVAGRNPSQVSALAGG